MLLRQAADGYPKDSRRRLARCAKHFRASKPSLSSPALVLLVSFRFHVFRRARSNNVEQISRATVLAQNSRSADRPTKSWTHGCRSTAGKTPSAALLLAHRPATGGAGVHARPRIVGALGRRLNRAHATVSRAEAPEDARPRRDRGGAPGQEEGSRRDENPAPRAVAPQRWLARSPEGQQPLPEHHALDEAGPGAGELVLEDACAAGGLKSVALEVEGLVLG